MYVPSSLTTVHINHKYTINTYQFASSFIIITHVLFTRLNANPPQKPAASNIKEALDSIPARGVFNGATSAASWR